MLNDRLIDCAANYQVDRVKRIWYLSPMRAAKVQASLRIRAVSPEPSLLAHTSSESSGTFRQKARSLAPLNGLACAVEICHDRMLEDTNSLDGAQIYIDAPAGFSSNMGTLDNIFTPHGLLTHVVNQGKKLYCALSMLLRLFILYYRDILWH